MICDAHLAARGPTAKSAAKSGGGEGIPGDGELRIFIYLLISSFAYVGSRHSKFLPSISC